MAEGRRMWTKRGEYRGGNSVAATSIITKTLGIPCHNHILLKGPPLSGPLHDGPYLNTRFSRSSDVHTIVASSNLEVGVYLLVVYVLGVGGTCVISFQICVQDCLSCLIIPTVIVMPLGTPPSMLKHVQEIVAYLLFMNQRWCLCYQVPFSASLFRVWRRVLMVSLEIKKGKEGAVNQSLNSVLLSLSCFVFFMLLDLKVQLVYLFRVCSWIWALVQGGDVARVHII